MNKILSLLLVLPFIFSCDGGGVNNNNPNIPNYPVNFQINLDLPSYNNLQFATEHVIVYNQGARGVVVFNTGSGYIAFDLACPNQPYTSCTAPITIEDHDIEATCTCDNTVYSLFSGQSPGQQYPMKQYRVEVNGRNIFVSN